MRIDLLSNYTKKKIFLIVFISAVVLYVDVAFLINFQLQGLKKLGPKITKLSKDLAVLKKDLAKMEMLKKTEVPATQEAGLQHNKLIDAEQIPALLEQISNIANKNNVKIMQINAAKTVREEEPKDKAGGKSKTQNFAAVLIMLDISCDYHSFGSFLNDLDQVEAIINVQDMKIEAHDKDGLIEKVTMAIKTYVKK